MICDIWCLLFLFKLFFPFASLALLCISAFYHGILALLYRCRCHGVIQHHDVKPDVLRVLIYSDTIDNVKDNIQDKEGIPLKSAAQ